jgi:hypothetical protein
MVLLALLIWLAAIGIFACTVELWIAPAISRWLDGGIGE